MLRYFKEYGIDKPIIGLLAAAVAGLIISLTLTISAISRTSGTLDCRPEVIKVVKTTTLRYLDSGDEYKIPLTLVYLSDSTLVIIDKDAGDIYQSLKTPQRVDKSTGMVSYYTVAGVMAISQDSTQIKTKDQQGQVVLFY